MRCRVDEMLFVWYPSKGGAIKAIKIMCSLGLSLFFLDTTKNQSLPDCTCRYFLCQHFCIGYLVKTPCQDRVQYGGISVAGGRRTDWKTVCNWGGRRGRRVYFPLGCQDGRGVTCQAGSMNLLLAFAGHHILILRRVKAWPEIYVAFQLPWKCELIQPVPGNEG